MFRSIARKYILTANTLRYRIEFRILKELIMQIPSRKLGGLVLDAGAGSGEMSLKLLRAGLCDQLVGVEPMNENFAFLKKNYGSNPGCACYQAGLGKIPLEPGSVDGVMSTQVFEHIEDHQGAASEVGRVLRKGGYALISTPHPPEIFPNEGHVRPGYTVEEMRALFKPQGFEFVDQRYFLTLETLRRTMKALSLGIAGKFLPIGWADQEKGLSQERILEQQPYGIACLFRKL